MLVDEVNNYTYMSEGTESGKAKGKPNFSLNDGKLGERLIIGSVFNPYNPGQAMRNAIAIGNQEIIKSLMDKIDIKTIQGEIIQVISQFLTPQGLHCT